jgi:hypothetical protein
LLDLLAFGLKLVCFGLQFGQSSGKLRMVLENLPNIDENDFRLGLGAGQQSRKKYGMTDNCRGDPSRYIHFQHSLPS